MKGLGLLPATSAPADAALPGIDPRLRGLLNVLARAELSRALAEGRSLTGLVLHVEPAAVEVIERRELVLSLRASGAFGLARKIERAALPAGHVLVFIDTDAATELRVVPVATLGLNPDAEPVVSVLSPRGRHA